MPVVQSPNAKYSHQTTGLNLIKRAMRILGALSTGENPSPAETLDGKEALNQMLDSWNAERLIVPSQVRGEFAITNSAQAYTIGPDGDFDCPQPVKIEEGDVFLKDGSVEYALEVYEQEQWANIPLKATQGTPQALYHENLPGQGNVNFYPFPDRSFTLVLFRRQLLAQVEGVSETIQLLPGYADAIVFNLAIALAPEYGKTVDETIAFKATEAKAAIKRTNTVTGLLGCDSALLERDQLFNIWSGE